jgi:hypothetical protein
MKPSKPVRFAIFALFCAAATLSLSLTAPATPQTLTDSDPQNPANWEFVSLVEEGEDTAHRNEPLSEGGYEYVSYWRDWDVMQWYRNSVAFGPPYGSGPQLPTPLPAIVGEAPYVDFESEGVITMTIRWIGTGSPPSQVRLAVTGNIEILVGENGNAEGDDGFGSSLDSEAWTNGTRYFIEEPVVQNFSVNSQNGHCVIVAEKRAFAQNYAEDGYAYADARVLSVQVDEDPVPQASAPWKSLLAGVVGATLALFGL